MDIRELRIGNLVTDTDEHGGFEMLKVESVLSGSLRVYCHTLDEESLVDYSIVSLAPIPLTSELLLRFGFKIHNEDRTSIEYWIGHNPVTRDYLFMVCEIKGGPEVEIFYRNGSHRLRFVHQLMNLYYALTGTELTLK